MKRGCCLSLTLALLASPAYGAPIAILSGQFEHGFTTTLPGGPLVLAGERGFTFQSAESFNLTFLGWPCRPELFGLQCGPGFTIGMTAALAPPGTATLDGKRFEDVVAGDLLLQLNSSVVLPPLAPTATATGTFHVADSFNVFDYTDANGNPQTASFVGSGAVTLSLTRNEQFPTVWNIDRADYDFSPVPEPATLLLVTLGLGAMQVERWCRRRHSNRRSLPEDQ